MYFREKEKFMLLYDISMIDASDTLRERSLDEQVISMHVHMHVHMLHIHLFTDCYGTNLSTFALGAVKYSRTTGSSKCSRHLFFRVYTYNI